MMFDAANIAKLTNDLDVPLKDYKDCFQLMICKHSKEECFLRECKLCPNPELFSNFLIELFEQRGISDIIYSTWEATDRCRLKKQCLSMPDFVQELSHRLKILQSHNFI